MIENATERLNRYETALRNLKVRREYIITEHLGGRMDHPWKTDTDSWAESLVNVNRAIKILELDVIEVKAQNDSALAEIPETPAPGLYADHNHVGEIMSSSCPACYKLNPAAFKVWTIGTWL